MKSLLRKIFSVENHFVAPGYKSKIFTIFGIKFFMNRTPKLHILNDYYVENSKVYLSIVSIAKNEGPYIKEWIEYHKLVGVERFYFYDNASTDNTREVLEPYIKDGTVVYNYCEGSCLQNLVYADAILKYKNQTRWLAIIDLDEYIVPTEKDNIPDFLKDYEKYPAVGINWVMFDSNGYKTKPLSGGGLVTANYTRVSKNYNLVKNNYIKSIVKPKMVSSVYDPHFAVYKYNKPAVNENFENLQGSVTKHTSIRKIRINHYYSKSEEEYAKKTERGNADNSAKREYVSKLVNFPDYEYDYAIQKYVPELKKRMNICEDKVQ